MKGVRRSRTARAFTLVEATVSVFIVGVMVVAALSTVGATRLGEYKLGERCRALPLAQDLLAEILQQCYEDPNGSPFFGTEPGEGAASRIDFDDVDDYHNWSASPLQNKDGTDMSDLSGWRRSVQVIWVDPTNLSQTTGSDQGVKRITVTVKHDDVPAASLSAFRTSAWPGLEGE
ncbi:MAG: type II secretion system protein [Planctomycetota bacterium]|jgi:type II secretory pathway pseudopilin PulG